MQDTVPVDDPTSEPQSALLDLLRRERTAAVDQGKEIAVLVKQTVAEIDHLAQRNREVSSQLRHLEINAESFSRAEMVQLFSTSKEAQMRLFMMQSQLEQLRNHQSDIERMKDLLDRLLELAGTLPEGSTRSTGTSGADQVTSPTPATASADSVADLLQQIELAHHRLSRQLQDGPSQALSDLMLRAEVCERLVEVDRDRAREELSRLRLAASAALRSTRQLVHELHPPALEELGIGAALRRYLQSWRAASTLQVELQIVGQERRLPRNAELAGFRIMQEALSNTAQHSGAHRAEVTLRFEEGRLVATARDDGHGFQVEARQLESGDRDSGLANMHLRARLVGGTLEISSKLGAGCVISLCIPA